MFRKYYDMGVHFILAYNLAIKYFSIFLECTQKALSIE